MRRTAPWPVFGWTFVATLALAVSSPGAGASGGETMSILFGMDVTNTGTLGGTASTLAAKGAVSGPGSNLGGGPLAPIPDPFIHNDLPHITYAKHGVTSTDTYKFTVSGGREVQGSRTSVLTLGVELSGSSDPNCPAAGGGKPGAHGVLTIVEDRSGSKPFVKAILDLPCAGVHEEWQAEAGAAVVDVALRPSAGTPTTSTQASPAAGAFVLAPAKSKVTDAWGASLTINNSGAGGTADWNHTGQYGGAGNGGDWVVKFSWKVPERLVPGQSQSITIGLDVISENPPQQNSYQMSAFAPDFAQAISITYPKQTSLSKTFTVPLHADYGGGGTKELTVSVSFIGSGVAYQYEYTK
jgi:hypothetical protein